MDIAKGHAPQNKRLKLFLMVGILIVVAMGYLLQSSKEIVLNKNGFAFSSAQFGTYKDVISGKGTFISSEEFNVTLSIDAKMKKAWVRVGDNVRVGEKLAQLSSDELTYKRFKEENNLQLAKLAAEEAELNIKQQINDTETEILDKTLNMEASEKELAAYMKLGTEVNVSKISLLASKNSVKKHQNQLAAVKRRLANLKFHKERVLAIEGKKVALQKRALTRVVEQLAQLEVDSPVDGVINYIENDIGKIINANTVIIKIGAKQPNLVKAKFAQRELTNISVGNSAIIHYLGQKIPAELISIDPNIENGFVSADFSFDMSRIGMAKVNADVGVQLVNKTFDEYIYFKKPSYFNDLSPDVYTLQESRLVKFTLTDAVISRGYVLTKNEQLKDKSVLLSSVPNLAEHFQQMRME